MSTRFTVLFACIIAGIAVPSRAQESKPADPNAKPKVTYQEHIQPIFREHCYTCHNQEQSKSDLALDSYAATMKGGAGGEVVLVGDLDSSRLWALVSHQESPKMPPEQDKLVDAKLNLIKQWILDGALENSGSKAKAKPKSSIDLKVTAGSKKPSGPPPMPSGLFREPFVYTARAGAVTALAASPWAPLIAVAGQKQILLYNSDTAALLGVLPFPEGTAQVLKFSRSGSVLMAGGGRGGLAGRVVLFDVKTGTRVAEVGEEVDAVLAADINDDHTLVALGGPRRIVRIYSVEDGTVQAELKKHTDWVYSVEFSPDGVLLATTDRSGGVFVWEADTGREFQNLSGHVGGVTDVSWRIDSNVLATCGEDGTIKIWEMNNGKQLKSWPAHNGGALAVEYARDGRIVSAGRDKTVKMFDQDGKNLRTFEAFPDLALEVAVTHDAGRVVAGDWTGDIRLLDAADGKLISHLAENPPTLSMLIELEKENVTKATTAAQQAAADLAAAEKAQADQAKAVEAANKALAAAQAASQKATADKAATDASVPQQAAALKAATEKLAQVKAAADKAAAYKSAAEKAAGDNPDAAKAAAEKATVAAEQVAVADAELKKATATKAAADKLAADLVAVIKSTADQAKQAQVAAEKATAAKTPLDQAVAAKAAARKAADEAVANAKAAVDSAIAEKAAYEKAKQAEQTQQAASK